MLQLVETALPEVGAYQRLRDAWTQHGEIDLSERRRVLQALRRLLVENAEAFARSLDADFRGRSLHESLLTEVALVIAAIDHTTTHLARWARPHPVSLGWPHWLASAKVMKRARGVACIIGPGNYPLQLVLMPLIGALSAGCRSVVKPSESAPRTAELLRRAMVDRIDPGVVSIVLGGPTTAAKLTELPFDILLFTGSKRVGRQVALAAAANLTPTILELGGKSAVIIDTSADLRRTARSIVAGKLLNAGQTCVAPDYVLVPERQATQLVDAMIQAAAQLYPDPAATDYTAILSASEFSRLSRLEAGHTVVQLFSQSLERPLYEPKLLLNPALSSAVMREEIFGPLLPIVSYRTLGDALDVVTELPPALVLYWFGALNDRFRTALKIARSAAVSVNETVIHAGLSELPLGGVGSSGMGRYHGRAGFDAFTHERPVFVQSRLNLTSLLRPPYTERANMILKRLLRQR